MTNVNVDKTSRLLKKKMICFCPSCSLSVSVCLCLSVSPSSAQSRSLRQFAAIPPPSSSCPVGGAESLLTPGLSIRMFLILTAEVPAFRGSLYVFCEDASPNVSLVGVTPWDQVPALSLLRALSLRNTEPLRLSSAPCFLPSCAPSARLEASSDRSSAPSAPTPICRAHVCLSCSVLKCALSHLLREASPIPAV